MPRACPNCGSDESYKTARGRMRCKLCAHDFTGTSRTALAYHKMPLEKYRLAFEMFRTGSTSTAVAKEIGCAYKTAWRLRKVAIKDFEESHGNAPV